MDKGCRVEVLEDTADVLDGEVRAVKGSQGRYMQDVMNPVPYANRPVIKVALDNGTTTRIYKNMVRPI